MVSRRCQMEKAQVGDKAEAQGISTCAAPSPPPFLSSPTRPEPSPLTPPFPGSNQPARLQRQPVRWSRRSRRRLRLLLPDNPRVGLGRRTSGFLPASRTGGIGIRRILRRRAVMGRLIRCRRFIVGGVCLGAAIMRRRAFARIRGFRRLGVDRRGGGGSGLGCSCLEGFYLRSYLDLALQCSMCAMGLSSV